MRPHTTRRLLGMALVLVAATLSSALAGCSAPDDRHPAIIAMESVLEMRRDTGATAEDYAPYFAESSVATALAESVESTVPAVPLWEEPYISAEETSTVDVVVVWKADDEHPDWPSATVFMFELIDDDWRITDALDAGDEIPSPLDTVDE